MSDTPNPIVDVVRWDCYVCNAGGLINSLRPEADAAIEQRVAETHAAESPACQNKQADWRFVDEIRLGGTDV